MDERKSWGDKQYRKNMNFDKCKQSQLGDKYGTPEEIANAVHHYLDWLRAVEKRPWDNRPMNNAIDILKLCQKGMYVNSATPLHYDEDPNRR